MDPYDSPFPHSPRTQNEGVEPKPVTGLKAWKAEQLFRRATGSGKAAIC